MAGASSVDVRSGPLDAVLDEAPPDGARFRPHVTLARTRRPADVVRWVRLLEGWASRPFLVEEAVLVESFLREGPRGRPRYEVRSTHPLGRTGR